MLLEMLVEKDYAVLIGTSFLSESVHVELPHEREEVGMFEMMRKHLIAQSRNVFDNK